MKKLLTVLIAAFPLAAFATAYTSSQDGNWSSSATWGGAGVPGNGDTASIGHNITVDVDTTVGTSPNNTTSFVVTLTAAKIITIATSKTFTIRGNVSWDVGASGITMNAGSAIVFDNSASGGSPIYKFSNNFVNKLVCNGTAGSPCSISAISGQTFTMHNTYFDPLTCTYTTFARMATSRWNNLASTHTLSHCTFDGCGYVELYSTPGTTSFSVTDCRTTNSTASGESIRLSYLGTKTSGTRLFLHNLLDGYLTYNATDCIVATNFLYGGISCIVAATHAFASCTGNLIRHNGTVAANGMPISDSCNRNYFVGETAGNPHFTNPSALQSHNTVLSQNIFESYSPDAIDLGDCLMVTGTAVAGGYSIVSQNNIILPDSYAGTSVASGTLVTLFTTTTGLTQFAHSTANVNVGTASPRSMMLSVAEGSAGVAGQVVSAKSNVAWASSSTNNQFILARQSGTTLDIPTAAGIDYNWTYNLGPGDNQRSYEDVPSTNPLWTAGDAVAAGVDVHQGSGDPRFYDSARNLAKWCYDRGYGTQTYTNAVTVLQNDVTKIPDLIHYVFEGYRPTNPALRNAAHDGGCVGAANWYQARNTNVVSAYRAGLSVFGL